MWTMLKTVLLFELSFHARSPLSRKIALPSFLRRFYGFQPIFSHVLVKGYVMVIAYLAIEVFAMKAALQRAKRTGLLLKLSE